MCVCLSVCLCRRGSTVHSRIIHIGYSCFRSLAKLFTHTRVHVCVCVSAATEGVRIMVGDMERKMRSLVRWISR